MGKSDIGFWLAVLAVGTFGLFWPGVSKAEAGDGVKAGDLRLHPRLTLSGEYDSNVFREDTSEVEGSTLSSPTLGISPGLSIDTIDPTMLAFDLDAGVTWDQYLASDELTRSQSGLSADGGLGLTVNPNGGISFKISDDLRLTNSPPPSPSDQSYIQFVNRAGGRLGIHPGSRILELGLGYKYGIYRYPTERIRDLAKDSHNFALDFTWRFLPKTAVVLDADAQMVRYKTDTRELGGANSSSFPNVDSTPVHVQGGLSGLLSRRLSARLLGGYATGLYENGPTYSGVIGRADFEYKYGQLDLDNKLALGYQRSFNDSSVGNYYGFHRVNLDWRQNFADKLFGVSAGGGYTYRDYAPLRCSNCERRDGRTVISNSQGDEIGVADLADNYLEGKVGLHSQFLDWWKASLEYTYSQNTTPSDVDVFVAQADGGEAQQLRSYSRHLVLLSTTIEY